MALETLPPDHRQMLEAVDPRHEPVLRSLAGDQAGAYAEEVRVLRRKVATLEAELAEARASRLTERPGACGYAHGEVDTLVPSRSYDVATSEFVAPLSPAVVPVTDADHYQLPPLAQLAVASPDPLPQADSPFACSADAAAVAASAAFAAAWGDQETTFEERFAAKAFFQVGTTDEESREWLLSADHG